MGFSFRFRDDMCILRYANEEQFFYIFSSKIIYNLSLRYRYLLNCIDIRRYHIARVFLYTCGIYSKKWVDRKTKRVECGVVRVAAALLDFSPSLFLWKFRKPFIREVHSCRNRRRKSGKNVSVCFRYHQIWKQKRSGYLIWILCTGGCLRNCVGFIWRDKDWLLRQKCFTRNNVLLSKHSN